MTSALLLLPFLHPNPHLTNPKVLGRGVKPSICSKCMNCQSIHKLLWGLGGTISILFMSLGFGSRVLYLLVLIGLNWWLQLDHLVLCWWMFLILFVWCNRLIFSRTEPNLCLKDKTLPVYNMASSHLWKMFSYIIL